MAIEYSPWLGYVKRLKVLEAAPPIVPPEAMEFNGLETALIAASNKFTAAAMAAVGGVQLQSLENARAADGTLILDQVGPDGQTLRQKINANSAEFAQLQSDPAGCQQPSPRLPRRHRRRRRPHRWACCWYAGGDGRQQRDVSATS